MLYLEISKGKKIIQKMPFDDSTYLIGRLPFSDIFLDSQEILPEQARIEKDEQGIRIYDLGSQGKLQVNNRPVKSTVITADDTVALGEFTFHFVEEEAQPGSLSVYDLPQLKAKIHSSLIDRMDLKKVRIDKLGDKELWRKCETVLDDIIKKTDIPEDIDLVEFKKEVLNEALALGPLEDLLNDDTVTEIMVNGKDKIYVERKGKIEKTELSFTSDENVLNIISRIVNPIGRRIDESVPMVDARLQDGSRVNAIIPPLVMQGPTLDIRKFARKMFTDDDLIRFGSVTRELMDFLRICVIMRKSILVSGGTGTGKTTFLNVIASYIPSEERVITIEDSAELRLPHEDLCSLESRPPNIEGKGDVTIRDLVRNSLRMRPDRIIVGECRGGEAVDMLQAMNTGHEGSMTTIHANTSDDAILRLETMVLMSGLELPAVAIRRQISAALHIIIQQTRFRDGSRKVTAVSEVGACVGDQIEVKDIFSFHQTGMGKDGTIQGDLVATGYTPSFMDDMRYMDLSYPEDVFKKDRVVK